MALPLITCGFEPGQDVHAEQRAAAQRLVGIVDVFLADAIGRRDEEFGELAANRRAAFVDFDHAVFALRNPATRDRRSGLN